METSLFTLMSYTRYKSRPLKHKNYERKKIDLFQLFAGGNQRNVWDRLRPVLRDMPGDLNFPNFFLEFKLFQAITVLSFFPGPLHLPQPVRRVKAAHNILLRKPKLLGKKIKTCAKKSISHIIFILKN